MGSRDRLPEPMTRSSLRRCAVVWITVREPCFPPPSALPASWRRGASARMPLGRVVPVCWAGAGRGHLSLRIGDVLPCLGRAGELRFCARRFSM